MAIKLISVNGKNLMVCSHTGLPLESGYRFDAPFLKNEVFMDWNCMITFLLRLHTEALAIADGKGKKRAAQINKIIGSIHEVLGLDCAIEKERILPTGNFTDLVHFGGPATPDMFVNAYVDGRHLAKKDGHFISVEDVLAERKRNSVAASERPVKKRKLNVVVEDDGECYTLCDGDKLEDHMELVEDAKGKAKVTLSRTEDDCAMLEIYQGTKNAKKTIGLKFI